MANIRAESIYAMKMCQSLRLFIVFSLYCSGCGRQPEAERVIEKSAVSTMPPYSDDEIDQLRQRAEAGDAGAQREIWLQYSMSDDQEAENIELEKLAAMGHIDGLSILAHRHLTLADNEVVGSEQYCSELRLAKTLFDRASSLDIGNKRYLSIVNEKILNCL